MPGAPSWPHCAHGADPATDPVGCPGVHVPGHTACLAHLADADRDAYLADLSPGANVDHRGTTFTESLLNALLDAVRDPATGHPRLGEAYFDSATFLGKAWFGSTTFERGACFPSATFAGTAWFESTTFHGGAWFSSATFAGTAWFDSTAFHSNVWFRSTAFQDAAWFRAAAFRCLAEFESSTFEASISFNEANFQQVAGFGSVVFQGTSSFQSTIFQGHAWFKSATFRQLAWFESATFQSVPGFEEAAFEDTAWFEQAVFEQPVSLGPFVCAEWVKLSGAVFNGPATLSFATRHLECQRTLWSSTAELRLRYAMVDFAHAVFEYPLTIIGEAVPFVLHGEQLAEQALADVPDATVRITSLRGVDAAHLVLADIDLSRCLFTGTVHLDQLRLEGACSFSTVPPGTTWRRWHPIRFTQRRVLAEEHHWRANQPSAVQGWNAAVFNTDHVGPTQLAPVYRALRKSFEDGKNEPGAADFYYGEMEMRRHDHTGTTRAERGLLHGYWALSGYGLRASRALGWLAVAMLVTIMLLMGFGLPQDSPKQQATGTVPPGGGRVTFEIEKDDPRNPTGDRFTGKRFEKAVNVTLNSVVFRSSGQDLTTAGTYIEMTSRLLEPALLALAVLAVRGRIKR
ncbi:pentapeptide repeat-containing protein [Streptomyces oryzae]|uniref:Pentapeptide repeat-containing protein n=2 Tax=Streptomyces oryzae TaxID=1434886 RepID=A0ABS3X7P9_9ACTN|nr:pentapeptide repeat-containing protein [Streptomyces oryzae]